MIAQAAKLGLLGMTAGMDGYLPGPNDLRQPRIRLNHGERSVHNPAREAYILFHQPLLEL